MGLDEKQTRRKREARELAAKRAMDAAAIAFRNGVYLVDATVPGAQAAQERLRRAQEAGGGSATPSVFCRPRW